MHECQARLLDAWCVKTAWHSFPETSFFPEPGTMVRDVVAALDAGDLSRRLPHVYADGRFGSISAHDIKSGHQLYYEKPKVIKGKGFYASPVLLNGKVLCLRQDGTTFAIEPGPKLKIVRENILSDGTDFSASPAIADGKIFLRSQSHLYCIGATKN